MDQNFGTPIPPLEEYAPQPKKKSNWIIILVIVLLVFCCCCIIIAGSGSWLWYNGDDLFGITSLLPALPPVM